MASKNDLKLYRSLKQKKFRQEHQLFIVEGYKSVTEFIKSNFTIQKILISDLKYELEFLDAEWISAKDFSAISAQKNPSGILAIIEFPQEQPMDIGSLKHGFTLILDNINDPGNLGTIIRIADWYNVTAIISSEDTVDEFNPKVIQASMGSLSRIPFYRTNLKSFIPEYKNILDQPIYAATMNGTNISEYSPKPKSALIIGNEANGISPEIEQLADQAISIPRFGHAESLNAGIATAILCHEIRKAD